MTDSVARAEAEKRLEQLTGMDYTAGKLYVNKETEPRCHVDRFGDWRKLWNHALSVMEENERLRKVASELCRANGWDLEKVLGELALPPTEGKEK